LPEYPVTAPRIVAPLSRHLDVADLGRAVTFYRDIVGFEVHAHAGHSAELTLGPARITLGLREPGTGSDARSILFFETDDVSATYDILAARGAEPSAPEVVNWIKMRMIQIRDPDGNTLWFGTGVGGGHERSQHRRMLRKVMPELPLSDVAAGVTHYRDVLGFDVNYSQHDIGVMDRDEMRVLLIARSPRHTGIGSCAFYVTDADALHAELTARGANVEGPPVSKPWGLREFSVLDPEGNRLTFAQTFE
jgi:uncharacterized glyoxalase superfamily protein PhnB